MAELQEVANGKVKKRRITAADWSNIAEYIIDEADRRKQARKDRERHWHDIDRQIAMEPDNARKLLPSGKPDLAKAWMAEMELPLQAQTLEVLTADARRMLAPDSGPWFMAHAALTDEYLRNVDFQALVAGDENEVPSRVTQDNADKLVEGFLRSQMDQYDFWANVDQIDTQAFAYGMGIGRAKKVTKTTYINTARGVVPQTRKIPILVPRSIKDVYLDDSRHNLANEGMVLGPSVIFRTCRSLVDVVEAANRGSNDPDREDGGWMPANIKGLDGDNNDQIEIIEYEGDLVVPRKVTRSLFIPGAIVTLAVGKEGGKPSAKVIRFRFRQYPFSSYLEFPYHHEDQSTAYPTSPLMKGRPVQIAATDALNRLMDAAALNNQPPIKYDRSDPWYAANGGPQVYPGAEWSTVGDSMPVQIGDPNAMLAIYQFLLSQYYDVTGVNQPRLGAQTLSHTTAYAKEAELSRGVVRTVDFVRNTLKGPLTKWLTMNYEMGRDFRGDMTFYIESYGGFVTIKKEYLPELVTFDAFGSGGPEEHAQKVASRFQAAMQAVNLETLKVQMGQPPSLNIDELQRQIMAQGGWVDVDAFFGSENAAQGATGGLPVGGGAGGAQPALAAALQAGV